MSQFKPFAEGPTRPKQVISVSFYRTGSHSLKEALTVLGYRDVFHSSAIGDDPAKWSALGVAADDNIACLPSYTGKTWSREDFDTYFGPCEALTDVTPLAEPLLAAYPEALVILVHRDFDSWSRSFQQTLVLPSSEGFFAWVSGRFLEPYIGLDISQNAWKMYMGLLGVCNMRKTRDPAIMRAGYERHYKKIRHLVPRERLLDIDLKDLDWEPLCKFLGKEVPDQPFPRLNESSVFSNKLRELHWIALKYSVIKALVSPPVITGAVGAVGWWLARRYGYLS